jgi:hypothetical protein
MDCLAALALTMRMVSICCFLLFVAMPDWTVTCAEAWRLSDGGL